MILLYDVSNREDCVVLGSSQVADPSMPVAGINVNDQWKAWLNFGILINCLLTVNGLVMSKLLADKSK